MTEKIKTNYQQLAKIMGELTITELWQHNDFSQYRQQYDIDLTTRVGSGIATYCRYHADKKVLCITYGIKMLQSKFNTEQCKRWLSYREIIRHQYFDSDTTLVNILSHTVCHEFAHAIQHLQGGIKYRSIHNQYFYTILSKLHHVGHAQRIKDKLLEYCRNNNISLQQIIGPNINIQTLAPAAPLIPLSAMISFKHKDIIRVGKVIKVNRKTVIVKEKKGLFSKSLWKVPKISAKLISE